MREETMVFTGKKMHKKRRRSAGGRESRYLRFRGKISKISNGEKSEYPKMSTLPKLTYKFKMQ